MKTDQTLTVEEVVERLTRQTCTIAEHIDRDGLGWSKFRHADVQALLGAYEAQGAILSSERAARVEAERDAELCAQRCVLEVEYANASRNLAASLFSRLETARKALEEIVAHCSMSREEFVAQGPAFACRQVERAVGIADTALAALQGEEKGNG